MPVTDNVTFQIDDNNDICKITDRVSDKLGPNGSNLLGSPVTSIAPESHADIIESHVDEVRGKEGPSSVMCQVPLKSNHENDWVELEVSNLASCETSECLIGSISPCGGSVSSPLAVGETSRTADIIDVVDDPALVYDINSDGPQITRVNAEFERRFGSTSEEINCNKPENYLASYPGTDSPIDSEIKNKQTFQETTVYQTADGLEEFLQYEIRHGNSDQQHGIAVYTELFGQHQPRQQLRVLHRVMRHNLRNRLTVIFGMVDEILHQTESEQTISAANKIASQATQLEEVSEQSLDAEDILDNRHEQPQQDISQTLTDIISESRNKWPEATIKSEIENHLPVTVSSKIREAILILIQSGIEHNSGDICVNVEAAQVSPIHLTTRESGDAVTITVANNGSGIPAHERDVVFGDDDVTQLKHCNGLGLWIVRWVVDAADGSLNYERRDGWTNITIQFPYAGHMTSSAP